MWVCVNLYLQYYDCSRPNGADEFLAEINVRRKIPTPLSCDVAQSTHPYLLNVILLKSKVVNVVCYCMFHFSTYELIYCFYIIFPLLFHFHILDQSEFNLKLTPSAATNNLLNLPINIPSFSIIKLSDVYTKFFT